MSVTNKRCLWLTLAFSYLLTCVLPVWAIYQSSTIGGGAAMRGADVTPPAFSSATINGTALVVNWTEACTRGGSYNDNQLNLDMSTTGSDIGITYQSGDGTSQWSYTAASAAVNGETVDLDFDGTANSIEDGSGNDLPALVSSSVTNNTPAACNTAQTPSEETISVTSAQIGDFSSRMWVATKFVYTGTDNTGICKINVHGEEIGDVGVKTITMQIRGHDAVDDDPDDTVYSYGSFNAADFPPNASPGWVSNISLTVSTNLTQGNTYWIVFAISGAADVSNYIELSADTAGTTERVDRDDDGTGTWTNTYADRSLVYIIYSE